MLRDDKTVKTTQISDKIWQFTGNDAVNVYFLDFERKIVIDCGNRSDKKELLVEINKIISPSEIEVVILTHFHYDHIGNFDIFENAKFYASKEEIDDLRVKGVGVVFSQEIFDIFKVSLNELPVEFCELKIIKTPGHTRGSICLYWPEEKIMFTGDTMFGSGRYGRVDLPTSVPRELGESVNRINSYNVNIFCPGHDYC